MNWFKAYNGLTVDPKFQLISHKSKLKVHVVALVWLALMDHASQQKDRGDVSNVDFETMDFFFQFNDGDFEKAFNAFVCRGMITDNKLGSWEERQRNDAAERQKAYRDRKKEAATKDNNALRPLCNDDNQSLEERRGEEKRIDKKEKYIKEFLKFWNEYPEKKSKPTALKAFQKAMTKTSIENILTGLEAYKKHKPIDIQFAHASSWLNQERWNDEYETKGKSKWKTL